MLFKKHFYYQQFQLLFILITFMIQLKTPIIDVV